MKDSNDVNLPGTFASVHLENNNHLSANKMLDEISLDHSPHSPHLYIHSENNSKNTYDQFFEEVSLDLPRDNAPSKLMKFMPRRSSPTENNMTITSSDISGPFYSISDVLNDTSNTAAAAAAEAAAAAIASTGEENNRKSRGARRNVNEAEVIVTSGGSSMAKNKPT
ncbi:hypothetical protein G6F56_013626 [Rhizopus delemar]|nr:hypothetical protein G6F56_013626 [Rhizopus delemar]